MDNQEVWIVTGYECDCDYPQHDFVGVFSDEKTAKEQARIRCSREWSYTAFPRHINDAMR